MPISQVMTSYTQPDFDQVWCQFVSETFDSLQQDSTKGALQYEFKSFFFLPWQPTGFQISQK